MTDLNRFKLDNLFSVAGQTVMITGGGSGIGRSLTTDFAGDVSTKAGAEAVIKQVEEKLGTLINCAGISILFKTPAHQVSDPETVYPTLSSVEDEDWIKSHQVNVNGPYYMSVSAIPLLRKWQNPNVVMISSVAGLAPQSPDAGDASENVWQNVGTAARMGTALALHRNIATSHVPVMVLV
nr:uncharacterized protein I203_00332 [Kwoniella mangroviensis CBS 8507]OCF70200.1 hypothetical protein I203_00332 [Kwoniella mangroviensis CBS 8507]